MFSALVVSFNEESAMDMKQRGRSVKQRMLSAMKMQAQKYVSRETKRAE